MSVQPSSGKVRLALLAVVGMLALSQPASAETIYATSINTGIIYSVDTTSHVVTPVFSAGVELDSLFFDPSGRIIYSALNNGFVAAYDPITHSNVQLATGLSSPIDLALEPNHTTFLVSDSGSNSLSRVPLAGGASTTLSLTGRPDGIAYVGSNLFVNVSSGFGVTNSQVQQINPTTGAVISTTGNTGVFLDGLTYDSFSGMLWATDYNNGRLVEINPTTMVYTIITPVGGQLAHGGPDGITSDGLGNLFIASRGDSNVIEYNIGTNTATTVASISGLDDLAPASGLGSPNSTPEPASILIAGIGGLALVSYKLRKKLVAA